MVSSPRLFSCSPLPLLLAAAVVASSALLPAWSLQLKPTPPPYPPKSLSPRRRGRGGQGSRQPLRASTVADNKNSNPWVSFLKLPISLVNIPAPFGKEDSLIYLEGGGASEVARHLPQLEVEAATFTDVNQGSVGKSIEKDELLLELNLLTERFIDLQSSMDYKSQLYSETIKSYETKVESLEEKNSSLEEGLNALSVTCEKQEQQLNEFHQEKGDAATTTEEENINTDTGSLRVHQVEEDNEMLRCRVRALEVELSDIAFESRHKAAPSDPPAVVANPAVAQEAEQSIVEPVVASSADEVKLSPKAPSGPVPPHIHQKHQLEQLQLFAEEEPDLKQLPDTRLMVSWAHVSNVIRQLDQLQMQVEEYQRERSSVRKLFGLGIRRGMGKVGKSLNAWSPVHNLLLLGKLRGVMEHI